MNEENEAEVQQVSFDAEGNARVSAHKRHHAITMHEPEDQPEDWDRFSRIKSGRFGG